MLRILSHCHPAPKGLFERLSPGTGLDGTAEELARCAPELGFDRAVALAPDLLEDDPDYGVPADPNGWLAQELAKPACAGVLIPFMRLYPHRDFGACIREMEEYAARGFAGIKIHPEIQRMDISDPGLDAFFAAAERLGLPVLTHTGILRGRFPLSQYEPRLFEPYVRRHPGLVLIMAHAGGAPYFRQVLALMQSYPNVYAELTCTLTPGSWWYIPPHELYLVRDVGLRGRLIYGADWPFGGSTHVRQDLAALEGLALPDEEKEGILGGALARILKLA
jgi:predicted TIM-barrel fold metal-dependent hydrolase